MRQASRKWLQELALASRQHVRPLIHDLHHHGLTEHAAVKRAPADGRGQDDCPDLRARNAALSHDDMASVANDERGLIEFERADTEQSTGPTRAVSIA